MPSSIGHLLDIEELGVRYPGGSEWVLNGFNLRIDSGETLALVGSSGSGKSTVARVILQMLPSGSMCKGKVLLLGKDPRKLPNSILRSIRGEKVGFVFQDPMTRLNPLMTVGGHLIDTFHAHVPQENSRLRRQRAEDLLERVGVGIESFNAFPHELSGGMRQRVAIALAIALSPSLVIADEPTTSLDTIVANKVMTELSELCSQIGSALILITHDLAIASHWCNRLAILYQGRIVEDGPTSSLLLNPQSSMGLRLVESARTREGKNCSASNNDFVLKVNRLRCWIPRSSLPWRNHWIKAVDEVSFGIRFGESLGVVGPSGCGKSTLCKALMGLVPVRGGEVLLQGRNILSLRGKALKLARSNLQMVFQDPLACLNPKMVIGEAISDPLLIHKMATRYEAREKMRSLLAQVGLNPAGDFENRFPHELSGGQQQRVAIARALAMDPKVLICDESLCMLDAEIQAEILNLLRALQAQIGLAILFVTHDLSIASGFCNRVMVINHGHIIEEGSGNNLFESPQNDLTKQLVKSNPRMELS